MAAERLLQVGYCTYIDALRALGPDFQNYDGTRAGLLGDKGIRGVSRDQDVELLHPGNQAENRDVRRDRAIGGTVVPDPGGDRLLEAAGGLPDLAVRAWRVGLAGARRVDDQDPAAPDSISSSRNNRR